jgi:hypothetical protein
MSKKALLGALLVTVSLVLLFTHVQTPSLSSIQIPEIKARTKATMEEKRENKALTVSYARALGYSKRQITCLVTLWTGESRFDHLADNKRSTAYGIAQLLREKSSNPELQILHGIRYIGARYSGDSCRALRHHQRRNWY